MTTSIGPGVLQLLAVPAFAQHRLQWPAWEKDALLGDSSLTLLSADFFEVAMKSIVLCFPLSSGICSPSGLGIEDEFFHFERGRVCSPLYLWVGERKPCACFHGFAAETLSRTGEQTTLCFFFSCAGSLHKQCFAGVKQRGGRLCGGDLLL